ncbi:MAG: TonB-dependent receptor plug domain-containing protein, partial [Acidobacteria bacterium]|nr:TonB-dependent receptor plug domain-containing protein [Acidobacteriota bacterium]
MHAKSLLILLIALLVAVGGTAFAAGDEDDAAAPEAGAVSPVDAPPPQEDEEHDDEDQDDEDGVLDFLAHDVVIVTGSAIEEPAVDLPFAVEVLDREMQKEQGSLQAVDLMKSLTASSGVIGEANSWYNDQGTAVPENVANVNLRGLGASRTLVLLNGKRQVPLPARLFGGRFVDVNAFPSLAIDRIEVLKEGAAAIYGSDAVAGVANFVTRDEFTGFEVSLSHESMDGAGDSSAGAIWGGKLGNSEHHLVFSLERTERSHLGARERAYTLQDRATGWFWGWSNTGNPGIFLRPNLTGGESSSAFVEELARARNGSAGTDYFVDPGCNGLGGYDRGWTCAFRYQPWDSLIEATETNRFFAELNGPLGDGTSYHVEALYAESLIPNYVTTPSFPPVSLLDGLQLISNEHPGRTEFCNGSFGMGGFASSEDCLQDDWYFYGRLVGNAGPGRGLRRGTETTRIAANIDHDLSIGGKAASLDVGVNYSRATGNMNHPAEYAYRKFLAFRGFGGPNCGVGVVADDTSPSGMRLGNTGSAQPGVGDCSYYNPFGNAIEFSAQPGAPWENSANPMYVAGLENNRAMLDWINEQVNVENEAELVVAEATLSGNWLPEKLDYAFGYQYRHLDVSAIPNAVGNYALNPCVVPGDRSCVDPATGRQTGARAGAFTFTSGYYPYGDSQAVHRAFGELSLNALGGDMQFAANYELHDEIDSFDPKFSGRWQLSAGADHVLSFRTSVQTTFRAPSVDDLNEEIRTTLEYLNTVGVYKAVDAFGSRSLKPEQAFTYNLGLVLFASPGIDVTLDYWSYDFDDVIALLPQQEVVRLYAEGYGGNQAALNAVMGRVVCPGGVTDGSCQPGDIERVRIDLINWPGIKTSGFDFHLGGNVDAGRGELSFSLDSTYTQSYELKQLERDGVVYREQKDVVGLLNRDTPIAPPLPEMKTRASLGYRWGDYSLIGWANHISSYEDSNVAWTPPELLPIDEWLTFDLTFLWRFPGLGFDLALSAINLTDEDPP